MTRRTFRLTRAGLAVGTAGAAVLLVATPAAAEGPTPAPAEATLTKAGTSFLTAAAVHIDQPVRVSAATGEYLYWSFPAQAGQTSSIAATVTLADAAARSGASTWTIDVFDGLRRRQPCTAGMQSPVGSATDRQVRAGCALRQVRAWAEPWSADPLPGTYYVRLSVTDLPEQDLGLPVQVELRVSADISDDTSPEGGRLEAPLTPTVRQGAVLTSATGDTDPADATGQVSEQSWWDSVAGWFSDWLPGLTSRWFWTVAGGVLAAVGGVVGFGLTRRPRRRAGPAAAS
ncbi:peptidase [Solwaraspora sp. WMMA2080]|uniref:peptidase n=1 Tax=unclassified Solwaraspora TaxID=2627926 RepID=UPI00248BAA6B|nr:MULTISPECIES: peptidase [unclassified Solwaraspora]WBB96453.1 peptidase [Solwaraspora sp. WMMA2059]WBC19641.1 peptidase [Solwaraspora sp. WMMA2080]